MANHNHLKPSKSYHRNNQTMIIRIMMTLMTAWGGIGGKPWRQSSSGLHTWSCTATYTGKYDGGGGGGDVDGHCIHCATRPLS